MPEDKFEDKAEEGQKEPLREAFENETPHLVGGQIIWANRDDEEVDAELYEMELNARDD